MSLLVFILILYCWVDTPSYKKMIEKYEEKYGTQIVFPPVTEANIVLGGGEKFADLVKGTELTFDAATLKFKKGTSAAGDVGFVVESKWGQITNGVTVKIVIK